MLYLAAIWTVLLCTCTIAGCGMLHWLEAEPEWRSGDRAIIAIWVGLIALASSLLAASITIPLSPVAGVVISGLWTIGALSQSGVRRELMQWCRSSSIAVLSIYLAAVVIIAVYIGQSDSIPDAGLYHYGLIRWFAEYGVTPGIVLLNQQLGFVSAWFAIAAPLIPLKFIRYSSNSMNGLVLLIMLFQVAIVLNRLKQQKVTLRDWFLLISTLTVGALFTQTSLLSQVTRSPSPDLVVVMLTMMAVWAVLTPPITERDCEANNNRIVPLVLAAGALSFKLTAIPLLLVIGGFYFCCSVSLKRISIGIVTMAVILFPFFTAQVLVSGCPLYPSTFSCFGLAWTLPKVETNQLANKTHGWATWFGEPEGGVNRTLWLLRQWFDSNQSSKLIAALILLSLIASIHLLRTTLIRQDSRLACCLALAAVGTTFMMLKAPLLRFGMGYILTLPALSASVICYCATTQWISPYRFHHPSQHKQPVTDHITQEAIKSNRWSRQQGGESAATAVMALITVVSLTIYQQSAQTAAPNAGWLPPPLPVPEIKIQQINDIDYVVSQDIKGRCWVEELPCVEKIKPQVELRNRALGIAGGFKR